MNRSKSELRSASLRFPSLRASALQSAALAMGLAGLLTACDNPSPLTAAVPIGEYPVWGQGFQKETPTANSMLDGTGGHGDVVAGKTVFLNTCALCHGPDGKGKLMPGMGQVPDLTADALQGRLSDEQIRATVQNGKGKMPPLGNQLDEQMIANVAAYVRSLNPKAKAPAPKKAAAPPAPTKRPPSDHPKGDHPR